MNVVDATDRTEQQDEAEAPSLLTIILDTNPHAWNLLASSLPLSKAVANLLVFINAHLAINHANRVAVIASHSDRATLLYPTAASTPKDTAASTTTTTNGHDEDTPMHDDDDDEPGGPVQPQDDANKYRPFAHVEHALLTNLRRLLSTTTQDTLTTTPSTKLAGALTLALTHISKQTLTLPSASTSTQFNYSDPTSLAGTNDLNATGPHATSSNVSLTSRILLLSVSGDLALQYIPLMNAIFACQRLSIPIDILKLAGDPVFLQQAADATGGTYIALSPSTLAGFLQYLMFAFLPDAGARHYLVAPGEGEAVDFRAACFCHRKVVDVGYVCSICLSIFCEVLAGGTCLTCGSFLRVGGFGRRPAVVPRRKKKRKDREGTGGAGRGTPVPG